MLDKRIFHAFFYDGGSGLAKSNTHFTKNHFFSYNTEIGCVINITKPVLLVAASRFSATTASHRSALIDACPYSSILVDFDYDDSFTGKTDMEVVQILRKRQVRLLKGRVMVKHRQLAVRRYTQELLENFEALLEYAALKPNQQEQHLVDKLKRLIAETPENLEKWKEERHKVAVATRKRAVKEKKDKERKERKVNESRVLVRKWFEQFHPNFGELLEACYKHQFHGDSSFFDFFVKLAKADTGVLHSEIQSELVKLTGVSYPSYVWVDDQLTDKVTTSQDIHMDIATVRTAYKAWKRGKLTEGMHLGPYIIQALNDQYVKIGCHRIPMMNVDYLAEKLQLEA